MQIQENKSIKELTNFKIGGLVRYVIEINSEADLFEAINFAKDKKIPFCFLGGGTNLAFADNLINMMVIINQGLPSAKKLSTVVEDLTQIGVSGIENLTGIPGSLGGAIVGNAGAFGHSIGEFVTRVRYFDGQSIKWLTQKDCDFAYRESIFKRNQDWFVIDAEFNPGGGDVELIKTKSKEISDKRWNSKRWLACPGSYFKNVLVSEVSPVALTKIDNSKIIDGKIPAGYLLDQVNARGQQVGDVAVSDFHANVIINKGNGTFADLRSLTDKLKSDVLGKFDINLVEEIRIVI